MSDQEAPQNVEEEENKEEIAALDNESKEAPTPNSGLEIDVTRCRYQTSKDGLKAAGLVFQKDTNCKTIPFVWIDGVLTRDEAVEYGSEQRVNKIPGMDYICYKSTLFQQLNNMRKLFPDVYNVYPKCFLLPADYAEFQREHSVIVGRTQSAPTWVIKPKNGCCGHGITLVQSAYEAAEINDSSVCQLYVNPFLLNQRKFDFRLYVLVASLDPLTIFIYKEGIARFCTDKYYPPTKNNKDHKYSHLTNTAINVENGNIDPSEFTKKFTDTMKLIIQKSPIKGNMLWNKICNATRAVILGVLPIMLGSLPTKSDKVNSRYKTVMDNEGLTHVPKPSPTPHYPPPRTDIVRKQTNMVLKNGEQNKSNDQNQAQNPSGIGAVITNYQLSNLNAKPLRESRKGSISPDQKFRRKVIIPKPTNKQILTSKTTKESCSALTKVRSSSPQPKSPRNIGVEKGNISPSKSAVNTEVQNIGSKDNKSQESKSDENQNETQKEEENKEVKKVTRTKVSKRYFHILGIDILVSEDCEPSVLELNDRPSLSVTVPFEYELKTKLIRDSFYHVLPGGGVAGNCKESDWEQIFPFEPNAPRAAIWDEVLAKASIPAPPSSSVASKHATNRMASSGINAALHQERRQRFNEIRESSKGTKFYNY